MYKVVIVDDELIIIRGLMKNIAWQLNGFEIVGSASNGEEGLQVVRETNPDLIITDIRMPFMDGFEFAEKVASEYPEIKILMLTSYDDFEFAQRALRLKVSDYLLKPIDNLMLLETASRAMVELEYERRMMKKVEEGMPMLRQKFLEHLVMGKHSTSEIATHVDFLGMGPLLAASYYVVLVLKADDYSYPEYRNRFGKEVLKFCVLNVAEETLTQIGKGFGFNSTDDEIVLIICAEGHRHEVENNAYQLAETIVVNVERFLRTTVTIGIGSIHEKLEDIAYSYQDACSVLEFRHIFGINRVLVIGDTGLSPRGELMDFKESVKEIVAMVKVGLESKAHEIIDGIEHAIIDSKSISLSQVRLIAVEMAVLLYKELEGQTKQLDDIYVIHQQLQQMQTVSDIFTSMKQLVLQLVSIVNSQRDNQMKKVIVRAVEYIEQHYDQEGLSLHDVSSKVHISPTYLSIVFKKEMDINFSDFLYQLRMKKAMELFNMQDLKSYEVADKVGYRNPQYFSVCFKKYSGLSPSEYKNAITKSEKKLNNS